MLETLGLVVLLAVALAILMLVIRIQGVLMRTERDRWPGTGTSGDLSALDIPRKLQDLLHQIQAGQQRLEQQLEWVYQASRRDGGGSDAGRLQDSLHRLHVSVEGLHRDLERARRVEVSESSHPVSHACDSGASAVGAYAQGAAERAPEHKDPWHQHEVLPAESDQTAAGGHSVPSGPQPYSPSLIQRLYQEWVSSAEKPIVPPTVEISSLRFASNQRVNDFSPARSRFEDCQSIAEFVRFSESGSDTALALPHPEGAPREDYLKLLFPNVDATILKDKTRLAAVEPARLRRIGSYWEKIS